MKKLTLTTAQEYALRTLRELPDLYYQWNILHSESVIKVLELLLPDENKEKLFALAWVHDIGKIKSEEGHAGISLEILKEEFELDEIDTDCILNHGSSEKPKTKEGKIFRYADGLSLFTAKMINFRFYAESKEGMSFDEINARIAKLYEKYKLKYSDSEKAISLLKGLFEKNVGF
ncbi:MAG: HD domain-containing protein [Nanoarchaeota archaeon]|nr:HD domain-containing protein [Nanoarchaeota archaeon]